MNDAGSCLGIQYMTNLLVCGRAVMIICEQQDHPQVITWPINVIKRGHDSGLALATLKSSFTSFGSFAAATQSPEVELHLSLQPYILCKLPGMDMPQPSGDCSLRSLCGSHLPPVTGASAAERAGPVPLVSAGACLAAPCFLGELQLGCESKRICCLQPPPT